MRKVLIGLLSGAMLWPLTTWAKDTAPQDLVLTYASRQFPVYSENGMVSAQDRIAAKVGRDILAQGGNAVDAAVATGFALAVTHPQAGNIGGGGFMMISLADREDVIALDFREMAPAAASTNMYLDANGDVDWEKAQYSHLSSGVPGTVMGLLDALETYGTMSRKEVIGPSVKLAERGFPVSYSLASSLGEYEDRLSIDPSSAEYFLMDGEAPKAGDVLKQKDLAKTLKRIVRDGRDGFYKGKTAELLIAEMQAGGGLITEADLDAYRSVTREAVTGMFRGYEIASMPPPSSGGVHIIQMLNILSGFDLRSDGHNSAAYIHKLVETMRRAYADRSKYLGDPDYFDVPVNALIDPEYAGHLHGQISATRARSSQSVRPAASLPYESPQTTHYAVMDKDGNAVAVTYTLNYSYGSGYSVDGAGFLLNNEMDDFSAKPGAPNGYGLIGGEANKIEPGKRPLSSMTPTIVKKDGQAVLVTGSIGGSRIITQTLQVILNFIEFDMNVMEAVSAPRIHHQWLPDEIVVEPGISKDTLNVLEKMGHEFRRDDDGDVDYIVFGRANSVAFQDGLFQGAADPRDPKSGAVGY